MKNSGMSSFTALFILIPFNNSIAINIVEIKNLQNNIEFMVKPEFNSLTPKKPTHPYKVPDKRARKAPLFRAFAENIILRNIDVNGVFYHIMMPISRSMMKIDDKIKLYI